MGEPFFLREIQEIVEVAVWTANIKNAIPLSIMLVADSGTAKSKILMSYKNNKPMIHDTDSFTSKGLFDIAQRDPENKVQFLMTPDLNPTLNRKPAVVQSTISNLLSLTADGTCRVDDGRGEKESKHEPMGLLTACTPQIYNTQAKKWFALGLRRRIIPIFFTYKKETENALMTKTREDKIDGLNFPEKKIILPKQKVLPMIPGQLMLMIESLSKDLTANLGKLKVQESDQTKRWVVVKVVPIAPFVLLQGIARAHAARAQRKEVCADDINFITRFVAFTDPSEPRQI